MKGQHWYELYHFVFEACTDAVFVYEIDGNDVPGPLIEVNSAACTMLGYSRDEFMCMSVCDLADVRSETIFAENKRHFTENQEIHTEWTHAQNVVGLVHPDDMHIFRESMVFIRAGEAFQSEHRIVARNGSVRWVQSHGKPWRDSNGVVCRMDAVTIDITDRKRSELESQERQQR